jgi:two-component system chemotaxis response regulator CheB
MKRVRVLVVEDSITVRKRLIEVLSASPDVEVVGEAGDGKRAIELCERLRPDVVTLDMMLPVMSGLAATEYIMAYCPVPILVVSSSTNRGELFRTYEALAAGAVDVLEKPTGDESDGEWEQNFIATVKLVSRVKVITHPRARLGLSSERPLDVSRAAEGPFGVVALGASTGGPAALVEVLRALPAPFPLPVLIVLHIGKAFGVALADWLDGQTTHRVSFASDGEPLAKAAQRVIVAPPDRHMLVRDGRIRLNDDAERFSCRPSVDVLFESLAAEREPSVACLLTGMGRDGAKGLARIHAAGGFTVAQDEATCVVFGMPREAILLGGVSRVLPLGDIGATIAAVALPGMKGPAR